MDSQRLRPLVLVGALALALAGGWAWQQASRRGGAPEQRAEHYARKLDELRARCLPPKPDLEGDCRERATSLLDYPECDATCVGLVRRIRGEPTR